MHWRLCREGRRPRPITSRRPPAGASGLPSRTTAAARSSVPTTETVHRGPGCTKGDRCPWVQRQLLDDFGLALDPRTGRAAIAYSRSVEFGDYLGCRRAANCPQTYYVEELVS